MKGTRASTTVRAGVLALSLLLLPITMPTSAQTTNPTPETQRMEMRDDDSDNTGLWGLLGLAGLIGLAGLRRRPGKARAYDTRD
jgi:MYXO-CTERM domain-containing protein